MADVEFEFDPDAPGLSAQGFIRNTKGQFIKGGRLDLHAGHPKETRPVPEGLHFYHFKLDGPGGKATIVATNAEGERFEEVAKDTVNRWSLEFVA